MAAEPPDSVTAELIAVLLAVHGGIPQVLTLADVTALPSGPFTTRHRSLQAGLRDWVEAQTHHRLGYLEQLYTFADSDRAGNGRHAISISYLGLSQVGVEEEGWQAWYEYFPWEDHRAGPPASIAALLLPLLAKWADTPARRERVAITFGTETWNEELVLQRYELLFEARLIAEAGGAAAPGTGQRMTGDHRRILATAIARLRAKIKYRPVVFELMPAEFTLLQLQRCVEAIAGRLVHKQNFRRLIEQQDLIEETGRSTQGTGGRPARLVRFRRAVLAERAVVGTKLPLTRG
jgi:hypothetical protein